MQLKAAKKKRWELIILSILLLLVTSGTVIVLAIINQQSPVFIAFLGIFVVLFCAYTIQQEIRLDRLNQQLLSEQFHVLEEQAKHSALSTRLRELTAFYKAMESLGGEKTSAEALQVILETSMKFFSADRGSIMLMDEASQSLVMAVSAGIPQEFAARSRVKLGESIAGLVAKTGGGLIISGKVRSEQYENFKIKTLDIQSAICVPLRTKDRTIGVLNCSILKKTGRQFTEHDLRLLMVFAQYATVTLEHAELLVAARKAGLSF